MPAEWCEACFLALKGDWRRNFTALLRIAPG
jgi:hypothetical protein